MFWHPRLVCSFCRKNETQVAKLVAGPRAMLVGPRVYICDACVAVSATLMAADSAAPIASAGPPVWRRLLNRLLHSRAPLRTSHQVSSR